MSDDKASKPRKLKPGYRTGGSSDTWMSPGKPYTGDGKKTRSMLDSIRVVFKKGK